MNSMSSKNIRIYENEIINTASSVLNLKENSPENKNEPQEINENEFYEKLKKIKYDKIFEDKFIEDFLIFETKLNEKNLDIEKLIKNKEDNKDNKENKIEEKFNLIKIYIDLKEFFNKIRIYNLLSENFEDFLTNINNYKKKEKIFEIFDKLCYIIEMNLFGKRRKIFSYIFLQNIDPKILKFLNRFLMIRIFFVIKKKDKKINRFSIINDMNIISKEILNNIIIKMINIYRNHIKKEELSSMLKNQKNEEEVKKIEKEFILNELKYFDVLLDYIYFENIFSIVSGKDRINNDKSIFAKYTFYYGGLLGLNNDNYSYINEYKWPKNDDNNYKEWNKYIKEEYENEGLNNLYYFLGNMTYINIGEISFESEKEFYETLFFFLQKIIQLNKDNNEEEMQVNNERRNAILLINAIIKVILSDENIFQNSLSQEKEAENIYKLIILNIKNILIHYYINMNKKEKDNNNEIDIFESKYINSLIILLESFGEYNNQYLLNYIFEKDKNNNKSVFDVLIDIYEYILIDLNDDQNYTFSKKNKLIILNSISNFLIEFIELSNVNENNEKEDKAINIENSNIKTKVNEIIEIKMRNLKTKYYINSIKDKEALIYDIFIIKNHLQILIHLIKNLKCYNFNRNDNLNYLLQKLQIENQRGKYTLILLETLNFMNRCFKGFINLRKIELKYEKDSIDKIKYKIDFKDKINIKDDILDLKDDVIKLLNLYKNMKLNELICLEQNEENISKNYDIYNELLILIFLNYEKIFYLVNSDLFDLKKYKYLININDNNLYIEYSKNALDYFFDNSKHRLIILFSFLQKIHDIIEIKQGNKIINIINRLKPEYLDISKNSMNYFLSLVDYSSPETQLETIYNYIECIIYDINRIKWRKHENCFLKFIFYFQRNLNFIYKLGISNYRFWEVANFLLFCSVNIFLLIKYSKSRNENEFEYNEIDNNKNFYITDYWPYFHIFILLAFLIYWLLARAKLEYFFAMTKYINEYFPVNEKLLMSEKIKLLNKDKDDFYINNFFPQQYDKNLKSYFHKSTCFSSIKKKLKYYYVNYVKVFAYSLKMVHPFILSIICLCLSFWSQIFFILPIFLFFNLSETLSTILLLFYDNSTTLLLIAIFFILILYIFSWIGFFFLPKLFKYEAVDKNNEIINYDYSEENICSSTFPCMLYFLNFGFRDSFMEQNLISYKNELGYYLLQFFFNLFLYIFIHLIFDNIFLVTISNAFDDMKKNMDKIDDKKENVCFICNKKRNDCIKEYKNFEEHIENHDLWKYIRYICCIILKKRNQYTNEEYYVWELIKDKKFDWFPRIKEDKEDEEEED